jgi:hypothetical protein
MRNQFAIFVAMGMVVLSFCTPLTLAVVYDAADFNTDCSVNLGDFATLAQAWTTNLGQPDFNPDCDLYVDDHIGQDDLLLFLNDWMVNDETKWSEGKSIMWTIAMAINHYFGMHAYSSPNFDDLDTFALLLGNGQLEGDYFTERDFSWTGSYHQPSDTLLFNITAGSPSRICSPENVSFNQDEIYAQTDEEAWLEGETIMATIAMAIRGYVKEHRQELSNFDILTTDALHLTNRALTGTYFSPTDFSWTGSYDQTTDNLVFSITADAPAPITWPSFKTLDQDDSPDLTGFQQWLEGKAMMRLIDSAIRDYIAQNGQNMNNFDDILVPQALGLGTNDLSGIYFHEIDFSWTGSYDAGTDTLIFTIIANAGTGIAAPVMVTLDQDGTWTEIVD